MLTKYIQTGNLLDMFYGDWGNIGYDRTIDIYEQGDEYHVIVEMAGYNKDKIDVSVKNGQLVIYAEKTNDSTNKKYISKSISNQSIKKTIDINTEIDENSIKASYKDGILDVTLPKKEAKTTRAKITIN